MVATTISHKLIDVTLSSHKVDMHVCYHYFGYSIKIALVVVLLKDSCKLLKTYKCFIRMSVQQEMYTCMMSISHT